MDYATFDKIRKMSDEELVLHCLKKIPTTVSSLSRATKIKEVDILKILESKKSKGEVIYSRGVWGLLEEEREDYL